MDCRVEVVFVQMFKAGSGSRKQTPSRQNSPGKSEAAPDVCKSGILKVYFASNSIAEE